MPRQVITLHTNKGISFNAPSERTGPSKFTKKKKKETKFPKSWVPMPTVKNGRQRILQELN